jgi:hypothetical protein
MQVFDLTQPVQKARVAKGTLLFTQGDRVTSVLVLHSGMAEMMSRENFDSSMAADPETLIADSVRVGLVKGQSVCGILGLHNDEPLSQSIVTVSECIVTNTPLEGQLIVQTLQKNMLLNLQVLRALVQRIESSLFLFNNYKYLWHKLASIQDSIAMAADLGEASEPDSIPDRYQTGMEEYRNYLYYQLDQSGGTAPQAWDPNVFLGRIQQDLDLYIQYDQLRVEKMFDYSQYLFVKRLLRKPDKLVAAIFHQDEPTNFYIFQFLGSSLEVLMRYNIGIVKHINRLGEILYAEGGWVDRLLRLGLESIYGYRVFRHFLWKFSWRCHRDAIKLLHRDFTEVFPVFKSLLDYRAVPEAPQEEPVGSPAAGENLFSGEVNGDRLAKYRNLTERILDFSEMSREFRGEILSLLEEIKELPDIQSAAKEHIELRERFTRRYWELYEVCFLKMIDTDLKSFIPGIMLHFGLIDETMVSAEELSVIDAAYSRLLYVDQPIPAMTLPYFLEKIYTGEINPSINEMGESFREVIKRQEKMTKKEREAAVLFYDDRPEDKVRYELRQVGSELAKMLHGSKRKALPVLHSGQLIGNLDRLLLDPETCAEHAMKFKNRDFSLFYREVISKHQHGTDLVKQEVLPNFVLYPVAGSRMMMWQELDGTKKNSQARFMLPLYFMENPEEAIGTVLGQFRWELSRSVAGANWMDPVEGGLSGAYYDYIQYFKKNPNLSTAHKEKLREFIKKTRSDRERFCADYLTWTLYEYEGKLRFNTVARDIFYRFVPFPLEMRQQMAQKPLYSDLEAKYENRIRKDLLKVESRIKKFEKAGDPVPEEFQAYLDFLNS